jgi:signal transduction histidine kinase
LPAVLADADKLERIVSNLLSNAPKYWSPDTTVTVTLSGGVGWLMLAVRDCGAGLPVDKMPRLSPRYRRTSDVR